MRTAIASFVIVMATLAAGPGAFSQTYGKPFCLQGSTGTLECSYDSMPQCLQVADAHSPKGTCTPRPGTTGAGVMDAPRGTGVNSLDRQPPPPH